MGLPITDWAEPPGDGGRAELESVADRLVGNALAPVPVDSMLRERAEVTVIQWAESVDALVQWVGGRPRVLLKQSPMHSVRRGRMTVAHELAHIAIPWHMGIDVMACVDTDAFLGLGTRPDLSGMLRTQEAEARACAGMILMPRGLLDLGGSSELPQFLQSLDRFEVSSHAVVIRLCEVLRPGLCFYGDWAGPDPGLPLVTRRTVLSDGVDEQDLVRRCDLQGEFTIGGKVTRWYAVEAPVVDMPSVDGQRPVEILRSILREVGELDRERQISGVIQGTLGQESKGVSVGQMCGHALASAESSEVIPVAVKRHDDWRQYLVNSAHQRFCKKSK